MALNDGLLYGSHFDSGTATDWSGNGNNGIVNGATATTDKNSVVNQALDFDGVNDYVSDSPSPAFPSGNSARTVSFWTRIDATTADTYFMSYGQGASDQFFSPRIQPAGQLSLMVYGVNDFNSIASLSTGVWTHIVYTHDGTTLKVYKDSFFVNSKLLTLNTQLIRPFIIGARNFDGTQTKFIDGKIDEPRIWDRALSPAEVTEVFNLYDLESSGYSNKSIGVTPAKIDGRPVANIAKFIGV